MTTSSTISAASRVNRLTTFSTEKIHSLGDNDNTRPIRRSDSAQAKRVKCHQQMSMRDLGP